jgi:PAS domain S-box-containing protein
MGHIVVGVASTREEFLRHVAIESPDIGILSSDFASPEELVHFATEVKKLSGLPLILFSRASDRAPHLTRLFRAYWSGVVVEPVDTEQLRDVLDFVIRAGRERIHPMSGLFHFCLVESLGDMVVVADEDDKVIYINKSARLRLTAYRSSLEGLTVKQLLALEPGPEEERVEKILRTVRARRHSESIELETGIMTPMNVPLAVSGTVSRLALPHEAPGYIVLLLHDSTRRKRERAQLLKLSNIVRNMKDKVVITSPTGTIEYVNPAFEACTGYSWQEAVGQTPRILRSGKHHDDFYRILKETVISGRPFRAIFTNRRKDGTLYEEDQVISPVHGDSGGVEYFVSLGRDVSDRVRAEQTLRENLEQIMAANEEMRAAVKIRADFVATVSHEIRTPLAVIMGCIENLRDGLLGAVNPEQNDALAMMTKSADQLAHIIGNVLDFEKMNEGVVELKVRRVDLVSLVRDVSKRLEHLTTRQGLVLDCRLPDEQVLLDGDPVRLEQVLSNLVNNAVKYARSHVFIRVRTDLETAVVEVEDDGPGIPEDQLESIFLRFIQARSHGTKEGTGLGLMIVRSIVKAHGGTVVAENYQKPDLNGARFTVRLPRLRDAGAKP